MTLFCSAYSEVSIVYLGLSPSLSLSKDIKFKVAGKSTFDLRREDCHKATTHCCFYLVPNPYSTTSWAVTYVGGVTNDNLISE